MEVPTVVNLPVTYPGFVGTARGLRKILSKKLNEYDSQAQKLRESGQFSQLPKYNLKKNSLIDISDRIKNAETSDAVVAILNEKGMKFRNNELIYDDVYKLGGKLRKGKSRKGKSRKGKSRKGKSRKSKTRRR